MGDTADDKMFLSPKQLAVRIDRSERTLQRWRENEYGPPYVRLGPRGVAYGLSDFDKWTAANTHQHCAAELANAAKHEPHSNGRVVTHIPTSLAVAQSRFDASHVAASNRRKSKSAPASKVTQQAT